MPLYRKKPVTIEAFQIPPEGEKLNQAMVDFFTPLLWQIEPQPDGTILIDTLEGTMKGNPGDYIIKGSGGEVYPCKPDLFKEYYEPVGEE